MVGLRSINGLGVDLHASFFFFLKIISLHTIRFIQNHKKSPPCKIVTLSPNALLLSDVSCILYVIFVISENRTVIESAGSDFDR